MPLGVITVNYGKQESIFEKLNPFVDKIVTAYKQKQLDEWDNEWMTTAINDIQSASDKATVDTYLQKANPPSGYIDEEGATEFAKNAIGSMTMHEQQMGVASPSGQQPTPDTNVSTMPQIAQNTPQNEASMGNGDIFPDKMEWNELYNFVSEIPTGQVDWDNTLNLFKERLDSKKKMGAAAEQFLNQILGQGVPDQRAKFEQDWNLTKDIKNTLYPESEQVDPIAQAWDRAGTLPAEIRADFLRQQGIDIPEGDKLDYDSLNAFMKDNNMKVKTSTVNDKGGQSFTLEPIEEEYDLNDIASMIKEAEQAGIDLRYTKDGFTMSTASETSNKPSSDYERWLADPEKFEEYKSIGKDDSDNYRATSLNTLNSYREKIINAGTWEEAQSHITDYQEAGYDKSQIKITREQWTEDKVNTLKNIIDTHFSGTWSPNETVEPEEVNGLIGEPTTKAELYQALQKYYNDYLNKLKRLGVDTSAYPQAMTIEELEKVGFLEGVFTGGGVARGQYKSIWKR